MTKKIVLSLLCGLILLGGTTGCNNKESFKPDFEVLDSKIDYIVIKDKKIYLTKNFKDFTLQFKGLGCLVNGEYQEKKEIDNIDENDPTLTKSARTNYITCYNTPEREWTEQIRISMHTYTEQQGDINEICWWNFSSTKGLFDLHINNKVLFFGKEERTPSSSEDLTKILGTNYEKETDEYFSTIDYEYDEGIYEYSFCIDEENGELEGFALSVSD